MSPPIKFAMCFTTTCVLLLLILHRYGEVLIRPLLPLYQYEIGIIADEYRILSFGIDDHGLERVVRLKVTLAKPIHVAGNTLMPDPRGVAEASTTLGHIWQMATVCLAIILSWPTKYRRTYLVRIMMVLPILIFFTMLDTPLVLLASIWHLILQNMAPDVFSALIAWDNFLGLGGRLALGIFAGLITVMLALGREKS